MTGPADGLYVGRGIKNDSEISDPALGRLELPLLKWGARGASTFGRRNQEFGFRPVESEVPLRSPGRGVGSYIGDTDMNFGGRAGGSGEVVHVQTGYPRTREWGHRQERG